MAVHCFYSKIQTWLWYIETNNNNNNKYLKEMYYVISGEKIETKPILIKYSGGKKIISPKKYNSLSIWRNKYR